MTLIGSIVALVLICFGYKPKRFHYNIYFEVGNGWGGLELGAFFLTCKNPSLHLKQHEAGHGIQNLILGVFTPFIVCIPSALRYWYRELRFYRRGLTPKTQYDDFWVEGWASRLGEKYFKD